ncbi:trafficking protein particle complex subunit 5-like [Pocillopora verrucosa]|uniref:trafficking protein particle complex subunit 5-like n=1 Tax=Pocillopora verrucosa TaxID=203993 RepID=UPI003342321D
MESVRRGRSSNILEKPLSKGRNEINVSTFGLLFSEMVQYCQNRVHTVPELQTKLSELGQQVGSRVLDVLVLREKGLKREVRVLNILLFIKSVLWKVTLFVASTKSSSMYNMYSNMIILDDKGNYNVSYNYYEFADRLEFMVQTTNEPETPVYIYDLFLLSAQKGRRGVTNTATGPENSHPLSSQEVLPAKVTAHWHKGTTLMIKFEESVIQRDKSMDGR